VVEMRIRKGSTALARAMTVVDADKGVVEYSLTAADFSHLPRGLYELEVWVTKGTRVGKIPTEGFDKLEIRPDNA
jgi:hypothetical protein